MILVKPDGREVEVNERSLEYALSLGWKPKAELQEVAEEEISDAPKRRGRPPKVKDDNDSSAVS